MDIAALSAARTMAKGKPRPWSSDKAAELMKEWPQSWAGDDADVPVGQRLVAIMHSFMTHLQQQELAPSTLRRHLDNLWVIGGEIIREVNDHPRMRTKPARALLTHAVEPGDAPLVHGFTPEQQNCVDATARRLLKFLALEH